MNEPTSRPDRLADLERFLAHDPANDPLLGDICDLALSLGLHERAEAALLRATEADRRDGREPPERWRARELKLLFAQNRRDEADALLVALVDRYGPQPALMHDRAWIAFIRGEFARCVELLEQLDLSGPMPTVKAAPVQALYVRALHRDDRADDAVTWADRVSAAGMLAPVAAAAASLSAIDAARFDSASRLAQAALAADGNLIEALVARASLHLATRSPARAIPLLEHALTIAGTDGRTWSTLGFARLQLEDAEGALAALERATQFMPEHVGTWIGLGWTRLLLGHLLAARQAFESAVALDRNAAESQGSLAVAMVASGDRAAADTRIELALRLDAACLSARYARHLLEGGPTDPASVRRLARELLAGRRSPLGDAAAADWVPGGSE